MKKRKQPSRQAIERKRQELKKERAHTLECNETRAKGYVANLTTLLSQIEQQYADGDISIKEYDAGVSQLHSMGLVVEKDETEEFGF